MDWVHILNLQGFAQDFLIKVVGFQWHCLWLPSTCCQNPFSHVRYDSSATGMGHSHSYQYELHI